VSHFYNTVRSTHTHTQHTGNTHLEFGHLLGLDHAVVVVTLAMTKSASAVGRPSSTEDGKRRVVPCSTQGAPCEGGGWAAGMPP
jgi:hypothetical protein